MAGAITINPNQPMPPVLSSNVCPPPLWPLPVGNWVSLPTVAEGFPVGPFTPPTFTPGTGEYPGDSSCPGSGMVIPALPPPPPGTTSESRMPDQLTRAGQQQIGFGGGGEPWNAPSPSRSRRQQRQAEPIERNEPGAE